MRPTAAVPGNAGERSSAYDLLGAGQEDVMITTVKKDMNLAVKLTLICAAVLAVVYGVLAVVGR
jgi:hypothetical protein